MLVYHKKNSYFVPEADAHLIPLGSYILSENGIVFVNDFQDIELEKENSDKIRCKVIDNLCQVNYLEENNEVRVLFPADTNWKPQNGNGDKNKYYFGVKFYAPNNNINGFKETIGSSITDNTMYYFENNDYAGIEENGDKYSIIWLPAASYNEENDTWTYFGTKSTIDHRVGWDYCVEWYENEKLIQSGKIKINLTNEDCHE